MPRQMSKTQENTEKERALVQELNKAHTEIRQLRACVERLEQQNANLVVSCATMKRG